MTRGVRVDRSRCGSKRVNTGLTQFHKLSFMFAAAGRQGSVRVNQELDAGPHGLNRVKPVYYEVYIPGMQSHTAEFRTGSIRN
jgi:hypothetical protein